MRVTGESMRPRTGPASGSDWVPAVYVVGPYVVVDAGRPSDTTGQTNTTVVDTRTGAVTYLPESVAGADGGTIATHLQAGASKMAEISARRPLQRAAPAFLLTHEARASASISQLFEFGSGLVDLGECVRNYLSGGP